MMKIKVTTKDGYSQVVTVHEADASLFIRTVFNRGGKAVIIKE